ncbi:MAG: hypothetical protein D9N14_01020 [Ketobacter sp.]|nr:MAG: hypothetical protein D9N14_01020 [Ketobacter sp.]
MNRSTYDKYWKQFNSMRGHLSDKDVENYQGLKWKIFVSIMNLAATVSLIKNDWSSNLEAVIHSLIDITDRFFQGDQQDDDVFRAFFPGKIHKPKQADRPQNVLVLGVHDDVKFLEQDIKEHLVRKLSHCFFTIDYESVAKADAAEAVELEVSNEDIAERATTASAEDLYQINEKIYQEIKYTIQQGNYDIYCVIIGKSYGERLKFIKPTKEKPQNSKRHYELKFSCEVTEQYAIPIFIFEPEPDSDLDQSVEIERIKYLKKRLSTAPNDVTSIERFAMEDESELANLEHLIFSTAHREWGHHRAVNSRDDLKQNIENSIVARVETPTLMGHSQQSGGKPKMTIHAVFTESAKDESITSLGKDILASFAKQNKIKPLPGFCILVHGKVQKQVTQTMKFLKESDIWGVEKPFYLNMASESKIDCIWDLLYRELKITVNEQSDYVKQLNRLSTEIIAVNRPLMLVLDNVQNVVSHTEFLNKIWRPLYTSLEKQLENGAKRQLKSSFYVLASWKVNKIDEQCCTDHKAKEPKFDKFIEIATDQSGQ